MRLVTFALEGKEQVGVLSQDLCQVVPAQALGIPYPSMNELIVHLTAEERQRLEQAAFQGSPAQIPYADVQKCAPIPVPMQDILCLGQNYMEHAKESSRYRKAAFQGVPAHAVYFSKRTNRILTDQEPIPSHADLTQRLDYEAELAVVIGRDAWRVAPEDAGNYIFGYMVANDVSARDVQDQHKQFYLGKSLEGFSVAGPWITTADEVPYPPALQVQSRINGELRQNGNTRDFIFGLGHIISELSHGFVLKAGSILFTGTPAGAGMGFDPPKFLKPGDLVECSVEGLGSLSNRISQE